MALDKAALSSIIECWGSIEDAATAVVLIGVIGELVAELTHLVRSDRWHRRLAVGSILAVIIGIAGELASQHRLSGYNGELVAMINDDAANASKEAADASERAANIEALTAWRDIRENLPAIQAALKGTLGSITLEYVQADPESVSLAAQISHIIDDNPGWKGVITPKLYSNRAVVGIHIPDRGNAASRALRAAFDVAKVSYLSDEVPEESTTVGIMTMGPSPVTTDAVITIGSREAPFAKLGQKKVMKT
jgi:hypothetical protein